MAIITPNYNITNHTQVVVTWANMATGDVAIAHRVNDKPELAIVQAEGTFNASRVAMTGSLSNVAYVSATDMTQTAISFTANSATSILEPFLYWKPTVTAGSSDSITITLAYWVSDAT